MILILRMSDLPTYHQKHRRQFVVTNHRHRPDLQGYPNQNLGFFDYMILLMVCNHTLGKLTPCTIRRKSRLSLSCVRYVPNILMCSVFVMCVFSDSVSYNVILCVFLLTVFCVNCLQFLTFF